MEIDGLPIMIFHGYVSHNQMVITTGPDFWNHPNTSRDQGVCFYDLSPKFYSGDTQLGIVWFIPIVHGKMMGMYIHIYIYLL